MKKHWLTDIKRIDLPKIKDPRGNLSVIEKDIIPFAIKRVFYLYDVPYGAERGGHAHKELQQFLIPLTGSFDVVLHDTKEQIVITLNNPSQGLLIPNGIWGELKNFTSGAVCLTVASAEFDEEDYIRDFDQFIRYYQ